MPDFQLGSYKPALLASRRFSWTLLPPALGSLALILLLVVVVDYVRMLQQRRKLPPGPFPFPLIGNHLAIPKVKPWLAWEKWAAHYNDPLLTLWVGRKPTIIVNDAWSASDLLEKRDKLYSSRPHIIVMGDMLNQTETNQTCAVYGDHWRLHRRLTHTVVGSQAVRGHYSVQANESKILTRNLMDDATTYVMSIERYSISVVSIIGWGRRIDRMNDYIGQTALKFMESVDYIVPGAFWMESIPQLARLPSWIYPLPSAIFNGAKHTQRYFYQLSKEAAQKPGDNFAKTIIKGQQEYGLADEDVAGLTANLIGGGVDTTSSSIITTILAMCAFPEAQREAHEELDRVVGRDRSPALSDETSLPYISAIVEEALRWRTVTVLGGIPHAPTHDDVYRGFHIPAGTPIIGNVWAIHRHPREFPDPDVFRPERFLNGPERRPYPNKKGHNAFGWGRRQCSGQPLAQQGLLLTIARLLWAFDMKPGLDESVSTSSLPFLSFPLPLPLLSVSPPVPREARTSLQ
ncbi:cytochrome P450 [Exophiala viscosa]|uniref:cytochrome P450 n=1 Tax=Exophiala viscosa TaxID=2486360 RepID=UPI002196AA62|nr:cytochrome P450 [Exophiala viscosa]